MDDTPKYLIDGSEVHVVEALKEGFLVQKIYEYDGEPQTDERRFAVPQVFDKPPIEKLHGEIAAQMRQIDELSEQRHLLWQEVRKLERLAKEQKAEFAKHEKLQLLMDFIAGKITHYVEVNWSGPNIIEFKDAKSADDKHTRDLRLLSLFGRSNGDLQWMLHRYYDMSGSVSEVYPCTGREAALAKVAEELRKMMEKPNKNVLQCADKYGLPIPDEYRQSVHATLRAICEERLQKHDKDRKTIEAELAALP